VGKTTLAVNLALAMVRRGLKTLLFDADMGMANAHIFAGINPKHTVLDVLHGRLSGEEALMEGPNGLQMLCGPSGLTELADLGAEDLARVTGELDRLMGGFDAVVVDTGAGISRVVMEYLRIADEIVVVVTPDLASSLDAYGVIKVAREAKVSGSIHLLANLVENEDEVAGVCGRIIGCTERFLKFTPNTLGAVYRDRALHDANQARRPLMLSGLGADSARRIDKMIPCLIKKPDRQTAAEPWSRMGMLVTGLRTTLNHHPRFRSNLREGTHNEYANA